MDSQGARQTYPQNSCDPNRVILNDSPMPQYAFTSPQFQPQEPMPQPRSFVSMDPFPTQITPPNIVSHRQYAPTPANAQYIAQVQQQGVSDVSLQGLLSAFNVLPTEKDVPSTSKGSKRKRKNSKKSQTSDASIIHRNWTTSEEIALTKAWLYVFGDADIGIGQTSGTLWDRILHAWRNNMGVYDETRNTNGLQCHWGKIQKAVSEFHGFYEQLDRNPRSGTTPDDMIKSAKRFYENFNGGQPFKFEHCWEIMKNNPKWCSQQLTKTTVSRKQKTTGAPSTENAPPPSAENVVNLESPKAEDGNTDGVTRAEGRKAAKERKKKIAQENGVINVLGQLQGTLEKQVQCNREDLELKKERDRKGHELKQQTIKLELELKDRNQKMKEKALKRKEQERVMNMDLSNLQPAAVSRIERLRDEILKEWENESLSGEVSETRK